MEILRVILFGAGVLSLTGFVAGWAGLLAAVRRKRRMVDEIKRHRRITWE